MNIAFARLARALFGATLGGMALVAAVSTGSRAADTPSPPVVLQGGGSWAPYRELTTWQDALYGSTDSPKINLGYTAHGTLLGRQDFLAGNSDFVISGVPFSEDELSGAKLTDKDIIDAPVEVASLASVFAPPPTKVLVITYTCDPYNPPATVTDPNDCITQTPYNDPSKALGTADNPYIKVPNLNLASMWTGIPGAAGAVTLNAWANPSVLASMNIPATSPDPTWPTPGLNFADIAVPSPVLRSDGDEVNYYLQQFVKTASASATPAADNIWATIVHKVDPNADPATYPITERLPRVAATVTRDGAQEQVHQLGLGGADPASGSISDLIKGVLAPAPASSLGDVQSTFPKQEFEIMATQNASGDWVAATPDSINAAVAAGGDTPLYALTHAVPGAYPLVWVDRLYAPAHGLSADKTEALATSIRYLATDGQNAAPKVGEGQLTSKLTAEALSAADQLVQSNCTGSDRTIVKSSDPGRLAPDTPGMHSIGTMLHCNAVGTTGTTTTAALPASSSSGQATLPLFNSSSINSLPTLTPPPTATPAAASTTETTKTRTLTGALAASNLPADKPASTDTIDSVATFLLGAGLFLLLRGPMMKLLARGFG